MRALIFYPNVTPGAIFLHLPWSVKVQIFYHHTGPTKQTHNRTTVPRSTDIHAQWTLVYRNLYHIMTFLVLISHYFFSAFPAFNHRYYLSLHKRGLNVIQGSAPSTVEITENYNSDKPVNDKRVYGPYIRCQQKSRAGRPVRKPQTAIAAGNILNKKSWMTLLEAPCQPWNCHGGVLYVFSSDLHWSQDWSRWSPKSLKSWKSWKRQTPV